MKLDLAMIFFGYDTTSKGKANIDKWSTPNLKSVHQRA